MKSGEIFINVRFIKLFAIALTALFIGCSEQQAEFNSEASSFEISKATQTKVSQTCNPQNAMRASEEEDLHGHYIVRFKMNNNGRTAKKAFVNNQGIQVSANYENIINGFSACLNANAIEALKKNPNVEAITADIIVSIKTGSQTNPTWGLDRIDQTQLPLNNTYSYNYTGQGVKVYIVDSGIDTSHPEYEGRAIAGFDNVNIGGFGSDCNGHGTHVAGIVGSKTYGVAKRVSLVAVRVLNCKGSGSLSGVLAGMDWVIQDHQGSSAPAIANMSIGGPKNDTIDVAVTNMTSNGILVVAAAGNSNQDACQLSPASNPNALSVGASTSTDIRASFSNYGQCVDLYAPGSYILSTYPNSSTAFLSGTSMAAPHVAGVAALAVEQNPNITTLQLHDVVVNEASQNVISGSNVINGHMVYSKLDGGITTPPENSVPLVSFSVACDFLACSFSDLSTDSDGTIVSWEWDFGDGSSSTATSPSHTYDAAGTYTVTLTVIDDDGASNSSSQAVSTTAPPEEPPGEILLTASAEKIKGSKVANLSWSGHSGSVSIYRRQISVKGKNAGEVGSYSLITISNSSSYKDTSITEGGTSSHDYKVCETTSPTVCSDDVRVSF